MLILLRDDAVPCCTYNRLSGLLVLTSVRWERLSQAGLLADSSSLPPHSRATPRYLHFGRLITTYQWPTATKGPRLRQLVSHCVRRSTPVVLFFWKVYGTTHLPRGQLLYWELPSNVYTSRSGSSSAIFTLIVVIGRRGLPCLVFSTYTFVSRLNRIIIAAYR